MNPGTALLVAALALASSGAALAGPRGVPPPGHGRPPSIASPLRSLSVRPPSAPAPLRRQLALEHAVDDLARALRQRADERALRRNGTPADLNRYRMREQMRDAVQRIGRDLDERALEQALQRAGHAARPLDRVTATREQRERDRKRRFDERIRVLERALERERERE